MRMQLQTRPGGPFLWLLVFVVSLQWSFAPVEAAASLDELNEQLRELNTTVAGDVELFIGKWTVALVAPAPGPKKNDPLIAAVSNEAILGQRDPLTPRDPLTCIIGNGFGCTNNGVCCGTPDNGWCCVTGGLCCQGSTSTSNGCCTGGAYCCGQTAGFGKGECCGAGKTCCVPSGSRPFVSIRNLISWHD